MATNRQACRAVFDCNVIIAAHRSLDATSPNRELLDRWKATEFSLLFSLDVLREYAEKLLELGVERRDVVTFVSLIYALGESVEIEFFHLPRYPADADDIAFLLCAWNGHATHLVTYDHHLLDLSLTYERLFQICDPLDFLAALRAIFPCP